MDEYLISQYSPHFTSISPPVLITLGTWRGHVAAAGPSCRLHHGHGTAAVLQCCRAAPPGHRPGSHARQYYGLSLRQKDLLSIFAKEFLHGTGMLVACPQFV